jgi:lysophospholipase L1-like esterase
MLKKLYPGKTIEVLNGGKAWYTTKHSLINYVTYCREWKPDLVIVMHALNDVYRSFAPPDYAVGAYDKCWAHFYGPSFRGAKPESFEERVFSKILGGRLGIWFSELRRKRDKRRYEEMDYPLSQYVSLPMYKRHLRALARSIKKDGAIAMLVSEPTLYKDVMSDEERRLLWIGKSFCWRQARDRREYPSDRSLAKAVAEYNHAVKRIAASEKAIFVDGAALLAKDVKYFEDDAHYTDAGYHAFAQIITDAVAGAPSVKNRLGR